MNINPANIPHIKYLYFEHGKLLYYLGGESDENLIIGKQYQIRKTLYSPDRNTQRKEVSICSVRRGKVCQININNFGTLDDMRDNKITQIIN